VASSVLTHREVSVFNTRRVVAGIGTTVGLLAALALPAEAAQETVTASIPFQDTDFGQPVSVAQFDPTLGELTQVDITADVRINGSIEVENTSPSPVTVTLNLVSVTSLTGPGFGPVEATATTQDVTASLTAFDGATDFTGPSSASFSNLTGSGTATVSLVTGTDDLTPFIGNGTVDFPVSTNTTFGGQGPGGNVVVAFENQAAVDLTVVYTYQAPAVQIIKYTNGEDADDPPGPTIVVGDPVTWTYVVTNTGDMQLVDVTVTDDQGVAVTCPQATLEPAEEMTCTASGTAIEGQYANTGIVVGTPSPPGPPNVPDDNPSHYQGGPPPPTTAPPTTAPPAQPPTTAPPQLPQTGRSSFPLAVVGVLAGLLGLWGLLAARKLAWSLLVDRDVDGLARELPTWQDPGRPR
jgi:LPXTG-motif cell wall-anchored protein